MVKIILYTDKYKGDLERLLKLFSKEVWDKGTCNVDKFINSNWCIYLALVDDKIIGFSSYTYNEYCGMREPTIGNTYVYVDKEYRTSRAMYLFSIQTGKICIEHQIGLEHYYGSNESMKLSSKLKGSKIYESWEYSIGEVENTFNRLITKVRIK